MYGLRAVELALFSFNQVEGQHETILAYTSRITHTYLYGDGIALVAMYLPIFYCR